MRSMCLLAPQGGCPQWSHSLPVGSTKRLGEGLIEDGIIIVSFWYISLQGFLSSTSDFGLMSVRPIESQN